MVLLYADGARDQLLIIQGYPRVTMLWALVWALGEHSTAAGKHLSEKQQKETQGHQHHRNTWLMMLLCSPINCTHTHTRP